MNNSIHRALWEWLDKCELISSLFFNFSAENDGDTAIIPAGDVLINAYIDGSQLRQYSFELSCILPLTFAENDSGNVDMIEEAEGIAEWIEEQCSSGNYPQMPDGYTVENIAVLDSYTGYIAAEDGNMAKYMISFSMDYMKGE